MCTRRFFIQTRHGKRASALLTVEFFAPILHQLPFVALKIRQDFQEKEFDSGQWQK
jgi:hypothetical protein